MENNLRHLLIFKMEKKDLIKLIDEMFIPLGFKRKGNNWFFSNNELVKLVNLQKSNYSNSFYINYGFIIKSIELTTTTHVENRLSSIDKNEQKRITDLLDMEVDIPIEQRLIELKKLITEKIVTCIQAVNTESDLLNNLRCRSHLNNIPLVVKKHFSLE